MNIIMMRKFKTDRSSQSLIILFTIATALGFLTIESYGDNEVEINEKTGVVTSKGNPITLLGDELKVGDKAREFTVTGNDMSPVRLDDFKDKIILITTVPSLDTPLCEAETKRFNEEATGLSDEVVVLTISMDLPFAQKRWCGAAGVDNVITLSDYRNADFGKSYGVLIKENRLLARTVFVIDKDGIIRYIEIVEDTSNEPDYDKAIGAVKGLAD